MASAPAGRVRERSRDGGAGGVKVIAGLEARPEGTGEQVGELALGEFGADVGAVACFLEHVGVGVRVMLVQAWPSIRLTWTTSSRMSMIRWLTKVCRRS